MSFVLAAILLSAGERPPVFERPDRPAVFVARPSPACECLACKCDVCKCERPTKGPAIIGAMPLMFAADGHVEAVGNTCYESARRMAMDEGRPLVVIVGDTPASLTAHARDNPVIYCTPADPRFPRRGLYRYDHGAKVGKASGLWQTIAPAATAKSTPKCANGKCRL